MTQRAIATRQWGGAHYGYGLTQADIDGHVYLGHGGSTPGFMSAMIADMDDGVGVVVLINGNVQSFGAVNMAMEILALLRSGAQNQDAPPRVATGHPEHVENGDDYAGTYHSGDDILFLTSKGTGLTLQWRGVNVDLEERGEDSFYVPHPDLEHFLLEAGRQDGRVVEVFHGPDSVCQRGILRPLGIPVPFGMDGLSRPLPHIQLRPDQLPCRFPKGVAAVDVPDRWTRRAGTPR